MPGVPNPFGFDMNELMRMLQSPGPVNMEVALTTARAMATVDLETGEPRAEPAVTPEQAQAFEDVVRAVQLVVGETTEVASALTLRARCVDRATWAETTLSGLETVLTALARSLGRSTSGPADLTSAEGVSPDALIGMIMQQLVPLLLGGWAGSMIGLLAQTALGQFDLPLPLDGPPTLLFVARNVDDFAQSWSLPADEMRYALALRETVHGAQRAVPWVRERIVELACTYVSAYEVRPEAIQDQFGDLGFDPNNPSAMESMTALSDPDVLLGAMRSERQAPLLADLQRFVAVLEGYTDVVVESIGDRVVTSHARIDEALRRHRLERGDAASFVDRLLGLELDRTHYDAGVAFCRGVVERSAGQLDQLNRLWTSAAMAPTQAELEAPGLWLARIDLP